MTVNPLTFVQNIVFFLTDDQDQVLGGSFPPTSDGGATPMPRTKQLLADNGVMADNFFIHTPVCCPSRAETLSGRYLHNLKRPGKCKMGYDGKDDNGSTYCCMHIEENLVHNFSFPLHLKQAGYTTGMFGKYLNFCPGKCRDECSGEPIPEAFDAWLANGGGQYFEPSFSVKNIDGLPDGTFDGTAKDYTTAVVGNYSVAWIKKVAKAGKPFLAYIAPKACHDPFDPAEWYKVWH
jgi:N-acetylglucosamine-6-sulfatase